MPHCKDWGLFFPKGNEHSQNKVIAHASQSLCLEKNKMRNYSFEKLELLELKWAVTEKLWKDLLGSMFTVYMNNNLFAYVR